MSSLIGKTLLNRYNVQEFLGRGGMAEVYKVWDSQRMTHLAMKVLLEDLALDRVFMRRFAREANTLKRLQHPNIVRFYGFEKEDTLAFMLMEYIEGQSLKYFIHKAGGKSMPYGKIKAAMRSVGGALHYAHSQGLVHCDIKPANIMIDTQGNIRLADFGIARMSDAATATMVGAGTPAYMAPEQIEGKDPLPQTDIYALGVVLYEMFTGGERPFTGDQAETTGGTSERVRWEHLHFSPPSPRRWNPSISTAIEAVILKCLQKEPENRYPNALGLVNALELALGDVATDHFAAVPPVPKKVERGQSRPAPQPQKTNISLFWIFGGLGFLALMVIVFFVLVYAMNSRAAPQPLPDTVQDITMLPQKQPEDPATVAATVAPSNTTAPPTITSTPLAFPTPTPDLPQAGELQTNQRDGASLVFIPEGAFQMGFTDAHIARLLEICPDCTAGNFSDAPLHDVYLDSYWIYKYEVTNGEYQQCVAAGACSPPKKTYSSSRDDYYENTHYTNYPVIFVDWQRAYDYCHWAGGMLPSEAQWEKAARGTSDLRLFPWGDSIPNSQTANIEGVLGDTAEVGSFPGGASPYGLMDMAGNVYEWINDWYSESYYLESPYKNPPGPTTAQTSPPKRVVRGGNTFGSGIFATV